MHVVSRLCIWPKDVMHVGDVEVRGIGYACVYKQHYRHMKNGSAMLVPSVVFQLLLSDVVQAWWWLISKDEMNLLGIVGDRSLGGILWAVH